METMFCRSSIAVPISRGFFGDPALHQIALLSESSESIPPIYIHENDRDEYLINGKVAMVFSKFDVQSMLVNASDIGC